ncbi:hypothetical protein BJ875DRAFT_464865 [Amylocarpus encephaloides]|uniref:Uncharacterized protein n=1 Tax=Amylocarpus encephaloides TaxID=45428 RepID=A0A9P7YGV0_9HELO|nr:hypothetical protein BJ875DRAFT_464865 [Amylocarpus encephaloides]
MSVPVDPPHFEHKGLTKSDGIRLLLLRPFIDDVYSSVRCSLIIVHTTLAKAGIEIYDGYTAFSYV